jgi:hypothetical protein
VRFASSAPLSPGSRSLTGLKDDLIRSFEIQLSERDHRIIAMEIELQSCYKRMGENEAEYRNRCELDRKSIGVLSFS